MRHLGRALVDRETRREQWQAAGEPVSDGADSLVRANEEATARSLELAAVVDLLEDDLDGERELAREIGPDTLAALTRWDDLARGALARLHGAGTRDAASEVEP